MKKAAEIIIKKCMAVKPGEKVLIITDANKLSIGKTIFEEAKKISDAELIEIPVGKRNGEEPPSDVAKEMLDYDVILMPVTKSLSHTKARINACEKGARIASMPNITEDTIKRTIDVDYEKMGWRGAKIMDALNKGTMVRVVTDKGTDISFSIEGMEKKMSKGIFTEKGDWGNLPSGEVCLAPVEGTANGVFVVDASFGNIGKVDKPIKITVKDGFAVKIEDGEVAEKLKKLLEDVKDKNAYNIAELGIGINDKAKITGNVLEDEKVAGTAHIALGNNTSYGGNVDVPIHVDGVFTKPTIFINGNKVIEDGELL